MDLEGQTLDKYNILEELGHGGMGTVHKAYDPALERHVAIKVLAPHLAREPEFLERFLREARIAANLTHPNIVTIHDVGQEGDLYYIVMAYLPGQSLSEIITERGPLSLEETCAIAEQVASALDYAHQEGVIHRDVKPSNILFDQRGRAVLTDFGIVRAGTDARLTRTGVTLGTPAYMSPEQAQGEAITAASDLYSLGIVVYEMLSGEVPFHAESPVAILLQHAKNMPPSLRSRIANLPEEAERTVLQLLSKDPRERPPTGTAFAAALRAAADRQSEGDLATAPTWQEQPLLSHPQPAKSRARPPWSPTRRTQRGALPWWAWTAMGATLVLALTLLGLGIAGVLGKADDGQVSPTTTHPTDAPAPATAAMETDTPLAPLPPSCQSIGQTWVRPADGMEMVCVPAGPFAMGSTPASIDTVLRACPECKSTWFTDEQPQHTVHLDAFWIDRTEVTNAQYQQCVEAGACTQLTPPPSWNSLDLDAPDKPAVGIVWQNAQSYCAWVQGRLPTEAEWEKACRGPDGWQYPWGNIFDKGRLNYCDARCDNERWQDRTFDDGYAHTSPASGGPTGTSPYGALNMAGNVWEWVGDWYASDYYSTSAGLNPPGPDTGILHVMRGGAWHDPPWRLRCSYRYRPGTWYRPEGVGFRCALPAGEP